MADASWSKSDGEPALREISIPSEALYGLLRDILDRGAQARFRAPGWSMYPAIQDGDVLTLAAATLEDVRVGDVVAVWLADVRRMVVHRAIRIDGATITCQGDNLAETDSPVDATAVLGIVTEVTRRGQPVSLREGRWAVWRAAARRRLLRIRGRR